jgi:hypothetical protein
MRAVPGPNVSTVAFFNICGITIYGLKQSTRDTTMERMPYECDEDPLPDDAKFDARFEHASRYLF